MNDSRLTHQADINKIHSNQTSTINKSSQGVRRKISKIDSKKDKDSKYSEENIMRSLQATLSPRNYHPNERFRRSVHDAIADNHDVEALLRDQQVLMQLKSINRRKNNLLLEKNKKWGIMPNDFQIEDEM